MSDPQHTPEALDVIVDLVLGYKPKKKGQKKQDKKEKPSGNKLRKTDDVEQ